MNRLATEASPYLRQHRDNPVDWYPWGAEAFAAAAQRDLPVLLSVGYSACHWCHVMAHELFEDGDVAAAMNTAFVNVKVDREERPDVDAIYMDAVQAMTGRGGWPMTVFLTPQGRAVLRRHVLPPANVPATHRSGEQRVARSAWRARQQRHRAARGPGGFGRGSHPGAAPEESTIPAAVRIDRRRPSTRNGAGSAGAPKFPSTMALDLLLADVVHRGAGDERTPPLLAVVSTSLDAMASGGIYDHLGGGFARYLVDERWLVPHFEKMLYDQALLRPWWTPMRQRRPACRGGGRSSPRPSSTCSAICVNQEEVSPRQRMPIRPGATGTATRVCSTRGRRRRWPRSSAPIPAVAVGEFYDITDEGNFEDDGVRRSIPNRIGRWPGGWQRPAAIEAARQALFEARRQRPRPGLDDKVLTEWNALMIASLAEAGAVLGEPAWIAAAVDAARFLVAELRLLETGRWRRAWHASGEPRAWHDALAADHAALIDAFVRLAEATGEALWIAEAAATADTLLDHFWDVDQGGLYTRPDDGERLIVRQKDVFDNATPSAN